MQTYCILLDYVLCVDGYGRDCIWCVCGTMVITWAVTNIFIFWCGLFFILYVRQHMVVDAKLGSGDGDRLLGMYLWITVVVIVDI